MTDKDKINFLKNIAPFTSLDDADLQEIAETMELSNFPPKEIIIRQGTQVTNFYVIHSGLVKVSLQDKDDKEKVIGFLGEGDCFGEISLLSQGPATTDIQAVEDTACMIQGGKQFLQMTHKHPIFIKFFNQLLTQRMRVVYKGLLAENTGMSAIEPYLYTKQVKDMVPPLDTFTDETTSIRDAAAKIIGTDRQQASLGLIRL
jgi:CRP-like cAMP-binding protein